MLATLTRRQAPDLAAWTYASGLVSALEGRLLSQRATLDLLAAGSLDEAVTRVRQTLMGADLTEAASPFELAESVQECFVRVVLDLGSASPLPDLAEWFLLPIEWEAFRAYLRVQALGAEPRAVAGSRTPESIWEHCWQTTEVEPRYELYAAAAAAIREAMPRETKDERLVDGIAYVFQAQHMRRAIEPIGSATVSDWLCTRLKWRLALALVRCRINTWGHIRVAEAMERLGADKQEIMTLVGAERPDWRPPFVALGLSSVEGLDPSDSAAPVALERLIDDATTTLVQGGRGTPFGPEPVTAFLWALWIEALNLRLVLTGLAAGLPADAIAPDLRRTHA